MGRWTLAHTEELCSEKFHLALQKPLKSSGLKLEEFCEGFDPQDPLIQKIVGAIVQDVARRRETKLLGQPNIQERISDASHYITTSLFNGAYPQPRPRRNHHRVRRRQEIIWPSLEQRVEDEWRGAFARTPPLDNAPGGDMAEMGSSSSQNLYEAYSDSNLDWMAGLGDPSLDWGAPSPLSPPPPEQHAPDPSQTQRMVQAYRRRRETMLQRQPSIRHRSRTVEFGDAQPSRRSSLTRTTQADQSAVSTPRLEDMAMQAALARFGAAPSPEAPIPPASGNDVAPPSGSTPSLEVAAWPVVPLAGRSPSPPLEHPVSSMRSSFETGHSFLAPGDHPSFIYNHPNPSTTHLHRSPSPIPPLADEWEVRGTHWR